MIDTGIDQAYSDLRAKCGGVREDYFGLLYLEREHKVQRERAKSPLGETTTELTDFISMNSGEILPCADGWLSAADAS